MQRVQAGDTLAFEYLWDRYCGLVYGVALRVVGEPGAAEDITQIVFLKIWARPAAFHGGSLGGWLSRVTHNLAIDVIRRRGRAVFVELNPDAPTEWTLDEVVLARIEEQRLRESLRALPEHQRVLIHLNFFEGKAHEEIATLTRLPLGTVKTRIRAGIGRLRAAFAEPQHSAQPTVWE